MIIVLWLDQLVGKLLFPKLAILTFCLYCRRKFIRDSMPMTLMGNQRFSKKSKKPLKAVTPRLT